MNCKIYFYGLTISMKQSPLWKASSCSACQEIAHFYGTVKFITLGLLTTAWWKIDIYSGINYHKLNQNYFTISVWHTRNIAMYLPMSA
jgi:hypothetical protein